MPRRSGTPSVLRRTLAGAPLVVAAAGAGGFVWLVRQGILYGTGPVVSGAGVMAGLLLVATAAAYWRWSPRRRRRAASDQGPAGVDEWLSRLSALAGVAAIVASLLIFLAPVTPRQLSVAACPAARTWNVPYVAVTLKDAGGNNGRTGPARSYPPNKRFPEGCALGFAAYCLGDPILDTTISGEHSRWVNNRWLELAKQERGTLAGWLAGRLSGERPEQTFMADSLLTPANPYDRLTPAADCPDPSIPMPGQTMLSPFVDTSADGDLIQQFTAISENAPNMGFAVWYPAGEPFINAGAYEQIYNPNGTLADNPGETDIAGRKTVTWPYQHTAQQALRPGSSGRVVILAVGCLAPNVPADFSTAATAVYRVDADHGPVPTSGRLPAGLDRERLARTACRAVL